MIWQRIRNLWELSKYKVGQEGGYIPGVIDSRKPVLKQNLFPRKKQVLATITGTDPIEEILKEHDNSNQ